MTCSSCTTWEDVLAARETRNAALKAHQEAVKALDPILADASVPAEAPQSPVEASNEPEGLPVAPEPVEALTEALSAPDEETAPDEAPVVEEKVAPAPKAPKGKSAPKADA